MQKLGYKLDAGKIVLIDDSAPTMGATPRKATQANTRIAKTPSSNKKRKIVVEEDAEGLEDDQDEVKIKDDTGRMDLGAGGERQEEATDELA